MGTITVEVDEKVLEKVAAHAAARGTTPDGLVRDFLERLATAPAAVEPNLEEARRRIRELAETSALDTGPVTWTRDDLHER